MKYIVLNALISISEPETVTSLTEESSSTSYLELSVTPPFNSVFVNYSVSIDDGYFYFS